jgi:hypothetical protein
MFQAPKTVGLIGLPQLKPEMMLAYSVREVPYGRSMEALQR